MVHLRRQENCQCYRHIALSQPKQPKQNSRGRPLRHRSQLAWSRRQRLRSSPPPRSCKSSFTAQIQLHHRVCSLQRRRSRANWKQLLRSTSFTRRRRHPPHDQHRHVPMEQPQRSPTRKTLDRLPRNSTLRKLRTLCRHNP